MAKASISKEVICTMKDERGQLSKVLKTVADANINITGLSSFGLGNGDCCVCMVTNNPEKTKDVCQQNGCNSRLCDVVLIDIEDRPGTCVAVTTKLAEGGVNLENCFFSCAGSSTARCFICCDDPQKAVQILG